jgi:hypothetical protein
MFSFSLGKYFNAFRFCYVLLVGSRVCFFLGDNSQSTSLRCGMMCLFEKIDTLKCCVEQ